MPDAITKFERDLTQPYNRLARRIIKYSVRRIDIYDLMPAIFTTCEVQIITGNEGRRRVERLLFAPVAKSNSKLR